MTAPEGASSPIDQAPSTAPWPVVWVLVAVGLAVLLLFEAHSVEGDGRLRFDALQAMLDGRIPAAKYPLIGSLAAIPLILLGHLVGSPDWWVARYNVLVYAGGLILLFKLLRGVLSADVLAAFLLLLGATAMFPNALTGFGAETFSALAAGTGLAAWAGGRWKTGTVLLAAGVANQPATVLGAGLALGWWAWRTKRMRAILPLALAAGLWLLDNLVRRGSLLSSGYEGDHGYQTLLPYSGLVGFSYPVLLGVASLLLSSGKGLLFFTPGLSLVAARSQAARRPVREVLILWLLFLAGTVAVYGAWWAWYGGYSWGPRFLLFASLPATLLLAGWVRRPPRGLLAATLVLIVAALSVWVGVDGATYGLYAQGTCTANHYFLESFCWYVPEFSVLSTPLVFHAPFSWRYPAIFAYAVGVSMFVAWPLLTGWAALVRGGAVGAWSEYRKRPAWRI